MELSPDSIVASGPVIIEDDKVLLIREQKENGITPWMFPGGKVEEFDKNLEETCHREVGEELGIKIEIIKPLKQIHFQKNEQDIILNHYLAKRIGEITPGKDITEWAWHDINNLPSNCTQNVYDIISSL
ncbi:MAG: hypothetical protein A2534_04910 [Candidatus Magasanikbacteria bacterium RIFOXYD2_FULL_39_9]|uniref:Nudix hydrolase domain-containing protein n=1 Tax=Candidatus Magasanikbacteria bacterium RIFOXYD1_FULL_40_23 TaxID=1798705 RepID=A0A1F6P874_9BACT|nr:MAG: hypothetical protein A2534_04910 [Candidatus Magasanikbacteria bacterium RIFOXYD2_FULL_39_9]OGH92381.1 MAG: hypothetical protein A2563_05380 [Candidatus Magasanikbacteria bacterium RIFOXYD1_FULL_40_23]